MRNAEATAKQVSRSYCLLLTTGVLSVRGLECISYNLNVPVVPQPCQRGVYYRAARSTL